MRPPALANTGAGDGLPLRFALEFHVTEQVIGRSIEEDRVGADAVVEQRFLQFTPDRLVAADVLRLLAGVNGHSERLAHGLLFLLRWSLLVFFRVSLCFSVFLCVSVFFCVLLW